MTVLDAALPPLDRVLPAVEHLRRQAKARLDRATQAELAQYTTPLAMAEFMASCFAEPRGHVQLLDAGAGVGSLMAAAAARLSASGAVHRIHCTAVELDPVMLEGLTPTCARLVEAATKQKVALETEVVHADFLRAFAPAALVMDGARRPEATFTHVVLNPPYKKINARSTLRAHLNAAGLDGTNLYTAFLDLAVRLLEPGGELVAITPRSYFNGAYFRPFRQRFLRTMTLERIHLIDSRKEAFKDDDVLQETVIIHARKRPPTGGTVRISSSLGFRPGDDLRVRGVPYDVVVRPDDPDQFIRVDADDAAAGLSALVRALPATLADLGLRVSTGRVVDFRSLEVIATSETGDGYPLIYPGHLARGQVNWPTPLIGKPNIIRRDRSADKLLVPEGHYVLVRRFSAKEEARRVSAAIYEPQRTRPGPVGFENKLNYIHERGSGLPRTLALGVCAYLNSTAFDVAFRQFSGHTQVNATDQKQLSFPARPVLERLGERVTLPLPGQDVLDDLVRAIVFQGES